MEVELKQKIEEGLSIIELSKFFNKSVGSIRYNIKKFKLKTNGFKKEYNWSKENLLKAIENSNCKSDVLRNLGITTKSGNFQTLDRYCVKYEINLNNIKYDNSRGNKFMRRVDNNEIFVINSNYSSGTVKKRIIKDGLLNYNCQKCGNIGEWMDEKIILQLDHINGVNNDNRLENLRFLCPNCHSQTETFSGKKRSGSNGGSCNGLKIR